MHIFAKSLLAGAIAVLPFTASATLLDPHEYAANDLTWLLMSETTGLSLNDFASGVGGWNTKYRFVLNSEVDQLIGSFGLQLGDTGYQAQGNGGGNFLNAFGYTYFDDGNGGVKGRGLGRYVWADFTNGFNAEPLGPECPAYFSCSRFLASAETAMDARQLDTGLLLVRLAEPPTSVPEPSSIALIGIAAWLVCQRRKKAQ